jgi:quinol monooxygenase YgiN
MSDSPVFLTVRGTLNNPDYEAARVLHNETAGSPPGVAAARALGDLSHKVFAPSTKLPGAAQGELLFLDHWQDPKGLMEFFSNPHVQQQGGRLFSARDATVWMPARGAFSYHLHAPRGRDSRFVGILRGPVASPDTAIELFRRNDENAQRDARRRGILSHDLYIKLNPPGVDAPLELLAIDIWSDSQGMVEHYQDKTHMAGLSEAFSGQPHPSAWEEPSGAWSEW